MTHVLVIGGGPAGSAAATLLAKAGISVTLLERARFPRYHIGESITVSCRSIIDYLGALEKIDAQGFTRKSGLLLRWGNDADWIIDWTAQFGSARQSWQVERADFDKVLLDHAAENGVNVIEGAHVKKVLFEGDRAVGATWIASDDGVNRTTQADFVLDASGRAGLISAQHFDNRRSHEIFRNVAIWGYWDGGELLPKTPAGGINVISSDDGWYWVIPLRNNRFSVGFVTHKSAFADRRATFSSTEEILLAVVDESPTVRKILENATLHSNARVEQDFSYVADSFCGPGHFVLGDAACFLDPLLSTGVHLAMFSGLLAAASVLGIDDGEITEEEGGAFYESVFRNAYGRLFTLVAGFYQKHAGMGSYLALATTLARDPQAEPENPRHGFGEITSGLTDLREAVDKSTQGREPIDRTVENARNAWTPAQLLYDIARQAQAEADGTAVDRLPRMGMMRFTTDDFYDAASGLHLVMSPKLGIRRARMPAQDESGGVEVIEHDIADTRH